MKSNFKTLLLYLFLIFFFFITAEPFQDNICAETLDSLNVGSSGYTLEEALVVNGDVTVNEGTLTINGYTLVVIGNLEIKGSYGCLIMIDSEDVVVVEGDIIFNCASSSNKITEGLLKVAGNFIQKKGPSTASFYSFRNNTVILNGSKPQTVNFENPTSSNGTHSRFNNIRFENTSTEGIIFTSDISISGSITGTYDCKIEMNNHDLWIEKDTIFEFWPGNVNAYNDWIVKHDNTVIGGNFFSSNEGTVDLSGKDLFVNGDLISNSNININGGFLKVDGSFRIIPPGRLIMTNNKDIVEVLGEMFFGGTASKEILTQGVLRVAGNFVQDGKDNCCGLPSLVSFYGSGNHTVILNGSKPQTIDFECPTSSGSLFSRFQNIEFRNSSNEGITITSNISVCGSITVTNDKICFSDNNNALYIDDETKFDYWPGNVTVKKDWILKNNTSTIDGDLFSFNEGTINLSGNNLFVNEDLITNSYININGGYLEVKGSFKFTGTGSLLMTNSKDIVEVGGEILFYGKGAIGNFTEGLLKVAGDFTQKGNDNHGGPSLVSFYGSENHTVILNGSKPQTIDFEYPTSSNNLYSKFQNIEFRNSSNEGITITSNISVCGSITVTNDKICFSDNNNSLYIDDETKFDYWPGNVTVKKDWILKNNTSTIDGTMLSSNEGTIDLSGNQLFVNGDLITNSNININGGYLKVDGSFRITPPGSLIMTNNKDIVEVLDEMFFGGKGSKEILTKGVLRVAGNFVQDGKDNCCGLPSMFSFYGSGDHTVILNGTSHQNINFESTTYSHFQNLIIENSDVITLTSASKIKAKGEIITKHSDEGTDIPKFTNKYTIQNTGSHISPTFADIHGHGDYSAFLGQYDGTIHYYENFTNTLKKGTFGYGKIFKTNSYASIPHASGLSLKDQFTIEFWMKAYLLVPEYSCLISKNYSSKERNYAIFLIDTGKIGFSFQSEEDYLTLYTPEKIIKPQKWYHYAVTFDRENELLTIFINGKQLASRVINKNPLTNDAEITIGGTCNDDGACRFFNGTIDEIRISNIVRYQNDFTPSNTPFNPDENTIALWHMDEIRDDTIRDASKNNHDGTWAPWGLISSKFANIDVGDYARPEFGDIDQDGDLDLLVGASDGKIRLFENIGNPYEYQFDAPIILTDKVGTELDFGNYASPTLFDMDQDGQLDLLYGYQSGTTGRIAYFKRYDQNALNIWRLIDKYFLDLSFTKSKVRPCLVDFNRNNIYDMLFERYVDSTSYALSIYKNIGDVGLIENLIRGETFNDILINKNFVPSVADINSDGLIDIILGDTDGTVHIYPNEGVARISINGNNPITNSPDVYLTLNGTGLNVAGYLISETSDTVDLNDSRWIDLSPDNTAIILSDIPYSFDTSAGEKKLYVRFKNSEDQIFSPAYDTIMYDPTYPGTNNVSMALPITLNQTIYDEILDVNQANFYSFEPDIWQTFMMKFLPGINEDNYLFTVYWHEPQTNEYIEINSFVGRDINELVQLDGHFDRLYIRVKWIGKSQPSGNYEFRVETRTTYTAGETIWAVDTGDTAISYGISGNIVFATNYTTNENNQISAYHIDDGRLLWNYPIATNECFAPVANNANIYAGCEDSFLYCLNSMDGSLKWKYQTNGPIRSAATIIGSFLYIGSGDSHLYKLDSNTGQFIWKFTADGNVSTPIVYKDKVYFIGNRSKLYCIDAEKGTELWTSPIHSNNLDLKPAISDEFIYVPDGNNSLLCLNKNNGNLLWQFNTDGKIGGSASIANNIVYIGSFDTYYYALNKFNGDLIWKFKAGEFKYVSSSIFDNLLFTASYDNNLYCLDATTGKEIWNYNFGAIASGPVISNGKLVFGSYNHYLYCLDLGDPNADLWPIYGANLQHTGSSEFNKTRYRYGFIQTNEVIPFQVYDIRLVEVYEDNDYPVIKPDWQLSDDSIAMIESNRLTATNNGCLVLSAEHDGKIYEKRLYLKTQFDNFESELNNTMNLATPLDACEFMEGELLIDDTDFYEISLETNEIVEFAYETSSQYADVVIDIWNDSDQIIAHDKSTDGNNIHFSCGLTKGTYYIQISQAPDGDIDQSETYHIVYTVLKPFENVPSEIDISVNDSIQGQILDYLDQNTYHFHLTERQLIDIQIIPSNPQADYRITLLTHDNTPVVETQSTYGQTVTIPSISGPDCAYRVIVSSGESVNAESSYTLKLIANNTLGEIEPNEHFKSATFLGNNEQIKGVLSSQNDKDCYWIRLDSPMYLDLIITPFTNKSINVSIYKDSEENLINGIQVMGEQVVLPMGLSIGKYGIQITGDTEELASSYVLQLSDSNQTFQEIESNNTIKFANSISKDYSITGRIFDDNDIDYYGFNLPEETIFQVIFKPSTQTGDYKISIAEKYGQSFYGKTSIDGSTMTLRNNKPPGNYYIKVESYGDVDQYKDYEIRIISDANINPYNQIIGIKTLVSLSIAYETNQLLSGEHCQLTTIAHFSDATSEPITAIQWVSLDTDIASVNGDGVLTGLSEGNAAIVANYGELSAMLNVIIDSPGDPYAQHHGNLILVAGGGDDTTDNLFAATQYLSKLVYRRFQARLFSDDDIYYFNPISGPHDLDGDGYDNNIVDNAAPTVSDFESVITNWAVDQNTDGPLYIYLIDHGGIGKFKLFPSELLNASDFSKILDNFQNETNRPVIVMIEACKSGSFTQELHSNILKRIIITCTDNNDAYIHLNGRLSFTQFFVDHLFVGDSIKQSWELARESLLNMGRPYSLMNPQMVNSDLINPDNIVPGGRFAIASLFPEIMDQSKNMVISADSTPSFFIRLSDLQTIESVWAVVVPPDYRPPAIVEDLNAPEVRLPLFDLEDPEKDGIFEGLYDSFNLNGRYQITFYAKNENGNISMSDPTIVTVSGGNILPGDINNDGMISLDDGIISLKICASLQIDAYFDNLAGINTDKKIGLQDVIYILQTIGWQ